MYPISDLTAFCRKTTGDVPPKLVGASTTVVGSKMYLYGGRLVSERKMVSDIYMFDLETFRWDRISQYADDDVPQARYFHSADTWKNHLIIFGGMAIKPHSDNPEDLCVLNDVRLFDLTNNRWLPATPTPSDSSLVPNARYAHLSSVTADRLFVVGGQDLANVWLDDIYIFDLVARTWIQRRDYPRHCGTYRSVAVTAEKRVRLPQDELRGGNSASLFGPPGMRFKADKAAAASPNATASESLVHLPYSAEPTDEYPCDIFLFSNYNFTDVQRELEVFTPLSDGDFTVSDRSGSMTGTSFPPGLRFPTGAILGTFFIVAGTYLSQTYQSFSIWALDLINMTWSRIDPGSALSSGSWFRSCLWAQANKFIVFGNRHGNLVEDYNRRLLSWDHVTCIDLEAFGIYQPPPLVFDLPMQELGLAALEEGIITDFEIVCDDGRKIRCSRKLLEDRWPWFKEQRTVFLQAAMRAVETMPQIPQHAALPEVPTARAAGPRPDPRLSARAFNLSEPYPITLALLQYFYSMALVTPLQHAPAVLSQLLLLASTYNLTHLQTLVRHAMHRALSYATSVGIYGVSTLCSCRSLQIRALRVVMAYSQKRPTAAVRSKSDKDNSGGRNPDSSHGPGGSGGGRGDVSTAARPRGMSDASYMRGPSEGNASSSRGFTRLPSPEQLAADTGLPLHFGTFRPIQPRMRRPSDATSQFGTRESFFDPSPAPAPSSRLRNPPSAFGSRLNPSSTQRPPSAFVSQSQFGTIRAPRRMASLDTISSSFSSPQQSAPSPQRSSPAPQRSSPVLQHNSPVLHSQEPLSPAMPASKTDPLSPGSRRDTARFSVLSQTTDEDLMAMAAILSGVDEEIPEEPASEVFASALESVREDFPDHSSSSSMGSSRAPSSLQKHAPSVRSSVYTMDSENASFLDDFVDEFLPTQPLTPLSPTYYNLPNLPNLNRPMPGWDDSTSVSSDASSYGMPRTPSLSRASSLQFPHSGPASPMSSPHPTPSESYKSFLPPPTPPSKTSGALDAIQEFRSSFDVDESEFDTRTIHDSARSAHSGHSTPAGARAASTFSPATSPQPQQKAPKPELQKLLMDGALPYMSFRPPPKSAHPHAPMSPGGGGVLSPVRSASSGGSASPKLGTFARLFQRKGTLALKKSASIESEEMEGIPRAQQKLMKKQRLAQELMEEAARAQQAMFDRQAAAESARA